MTLQFLLRPIACHVADFGGDIRVTTRPTARAMITPSRLTANAAPATTASPGITPHWLKQNIGFDHDRGELLDEIEPNKR